MKILRVLNTNAVVSTDPHGQEIIITGAGIGFKKKKGEELDKSLVEKIYCLKSREDNYRFASLGPMLCARMVPWPRSGTKFAEMPMFSSLER